METIRTKSHWQVDDIWQEGKNPRVNKYLSAEDDDLFVSYHGISLHNCLSIAKEGFKLRKTKRFLNRRCIYLTPDIDVAFLFHYLQR